MAWGSSAGSFTIRFDGAGHFGEAKNRVADQIGGCFIAGDEQQGAEAQQFSHIQFLPVNLGGKQVADQIIAGPAPSLFDQVQEVPGHLLVGGLVVLSRRTGPCLAHDHIGPLLEAVAVIRGYTHEFRDHDDRQRDTPMPRSGPLIRGMRSRPEVPP